MSGLIRLLLLAGALFIVPASHGAPTRLTLLLSGKDASLLRHAAATAAGGQTIGWLRTQSAIERATIGPDHQTIEVTYRDGSRAAILPASRSRTINPLPPELVAPRLTTVAAHGIVGRAVVLEPFASQLNVGPRAGDAVVAQLRAAGYSVDQGYDGAVTVGTMASLATYNVVYMLTHSGVNQWGDGVVATGQLYNHDPPADALVKDDSAMVVGVVGSANLYYGILSGYFRNHVDSLMPSSLFFLDGCSLLKATLLWQALQAKGAGAMVSWSEESMVQDDQTAGAVFFAAMEQHNTVGQAVDIVLQTGHGTSTVEGQPTAHFGYLGDGTLSLYPPPPTETPAPTATPTATATVTPRPTPTAKHPASAKRLRACRKGYHRVRGRCRKRSAG